MGKDTPFLCTEKIKICGRITKLEVIRMQYACIFSISAEYLQKFEFFYFPKYCSNTPKVRWAMSYGFCSKFHTISSSVKTLRIG